MVTQEQYNKLAQQRDVLLNVLSRIEDKLEYSQDVIKKDEFVSIIENANTQLRKIKNSG